LFNSFCFNNCRTVPTSSCQLSRRLTTRSYDIIQNWRHT